MWVFLTHKGRMVLRMGPPQALRCATRTCVGGALPWVGMHHPYARLILVTFLLLAGAVASAASVGEESADAERSLPAPPEHARRQVHLDRLALIGATAAGLHYVGFRYFDRAWYQGQKLDRIRWVQDWDGETYLNLDKGGHFMGGLVMARSMADALEWSGVGVRTAAAAGTLASWGVLLEIEMRDAHFDQWGFSIPDFAANTIGAAVPLLQALIPQTRALGCKFSYHPSPLYLDRERRARRDRPHIEHLIDDYEGMTFWVTLALEDVLPAAAAETWPDFLGLALGYGATGLHGSNVKSKGINRFYKDLPDARPEVYVSLDYDARRLPGDGGFWCLVKERLNWIHFPAPALRVRPDWRFYLLYM